MDSQVASNSSARQRPAPHARCTSTPRSWSIAASFSRGVWTDTSSPTAFARQFGHRATRPRRGEGERPALVLDLGRAEHVHRDAGGQLFGEGHHVLVVPVGGVDLEHRELGVVARAHALVAKDAADLEDPLEAAHDESLQPQFRRDAQVEVGVERVVVRGEGPRVRARRDRVQDRRLDLHEVLRPAALAHGAHDVVAPLQGRARHRIGPEVGLAVAIAQVEIGDAGPLVAEVALRPSPASPTSPP